jgi:hypothetical protein
MNVSDIRVVSVLGYMCVCVCVIVLRSRPKVTVLKLSYFLPLSES